MAKHHSLYRSQGGSDDEWNLVELSDYDHAYEHALDFVLFDKAPWFDCRQNGWPLLPKDLQEAVLKEMSRRMSECQLGQANPFYGKTHSAPTRKLISNAQSGVPETPESNAKRSKTLKGRPKSEEWKKKIGLGNKGKPKPIRTCPHCGKQGPSSTMHRWHFDNCKQKEN